MLRRTVELCAGRIGLVASHVVDCLVQACEDTVLAAASVREGPIVRQHRECTVGTLPEDASLVVAQEYVLSLVELRDRGLEIVQQVTRPSGVKTPEKLVHAAIIRFRLDFGYGRGIVAGYHRLLVVVEDVLVGAATDNNRSGSNGDEQARKRAVVRFH